MKGTLLAVQPPSSQWVSAKLGDVTTKIGSGATPLGGEAAYKQSGTALIRSLNVHDSEFNWKNLAFIDDSQATRLGNVVVEPNDVLLNITGASVARCCVVPPSALPARVNQHVAIVRPNADRLLPQFLQYLLVSNVYKNRLLGVGESAGSTRQALTKSQLQSFVVEFPASLAEQARIVAILNEAFEGIAIARANAEKNLQNAREWAVGQLSKSLTDASASGRSGTLETLVAPSCTLSYGIVQPGDEVPGGLPLVRPVDLGEKTVYVEGLKRIDPSLARPYARTTLEGDDLLLCVRGTTGTVAIAEPALAGANVTRGIVPIRFEPSIVTQSLGYYLLLSEPVQAQIRAKTYGTALMQINIGDLRKIVVRFPPVEKQAALVRQLDAIQEAADQLIDVNERKLAALDELKKALLHQAFTGQLISAKTTPVTVSMAPPTTSPEFSANVIALAYERHKRQQRERTFGHVKEQKLLHLVEAIAKVDLGRRPMKDAAGPNDFPQMLKAEEWAKQMDFFEMLQREGGYDFKKLPAFDQMLSKLPQVLGTCLDRIESVIDLLIPMDTEDAEVFATVHAAWNNLLIDGAEVTEAALIWEARDGWHANKLAIPESKFRQAIALIRSEGLVPDGTGKYVGGQTSLL